MAGPTKIEWTDTTWLFGEPLPRRCAKCRVVKPVSEFPNDHSRADGHGYVCRNCRRVTPLQVPNRPERIAARLKGLAWCSGCKEWKSASEVLRSGRCRMHLPWPPRGLVMGNIGAVGDWRGQHVGGEKR